MTLDERIQQLYEDWCNRKVDLVTGIRRIIEDELAKGSK